MPTARAKYTWCWAMPVDSIIDAVPTDAFADTSPVPVDSTTSTVPDTFADTTPVPVDSIIGAVLDAFANVNPVPVDSTIDDVPDAFTDTMPVPEENTVGAIPDAFIDTSPVPIDSAIDEYASDAFADKDPPVPGPDVMTELPTPVGDNNDDVPDWVVEFSVEYGVFESVHDSLAELSEVDSTLRDVSEPVVKAIGVDVDAADVTVSGHCEVLDEVEDEFETLADVRLRGYIGGDAAANAWLRQ
ncbi:hypothetical protein K470DRAFT_269933 [Piedraia hortae CBS 480.64]|uniref:Uncharacterized protein n=1 Tax=Piedraia hortae CBS 480.64 TaxID=1314780 RepID=A0A6A7C2Q9_9PEZI|nr:hypothetical protein K470DRAFT_269933 [Piedraia hortae CBS 480.64]